VSVITAAAPPIWKIVTVMVGGPPWNGELSSLYVCELVTVYTPLASGPEIWSGEIIPSPQLTVAENSLAGAQGLEGLVKASNVTLMKGCPSTPRRVKPPPTGNGAPTLTKSAAVTGGADSWKTVT